MSRTVRWWLAGLLVLAVFAGATWVSGAFILQRALASSADRWVVGSAIGVALAAFIALWGSWWAAQGDSTAAGSGNPASACAKEVAACGDRSVAVGRDNIGIVSTGDDAINTQDR